MEELFIDADWEQQQQDKEQALQMLVAAGSSKPVISGDEKQALWAAGKAAREAAAAKLAIQLQETEAAFQQMAEGSRDQWFVDHAGQSAADERELQFEDEWSQLPADILAMVQEMKSRQ